MSSPVYNCLIVDDEPLARDVLKRYIQKLPMLNLAGECSNALQVIPFLHSHTVDLLFLDIQMPQLTGLELVSALTNPPKIIFTTAFGEYALQSYDLDAADYLLKPIKLDRFIKAVNKALPVVMPTNIGIPVTTAPVAPMADSGTFLYFRADRKMVKVQLDTILYIESLKDYVKIITETDQVITKYSMAALEAMLPSSGFIRIHRSYIINMQKLKSYTASHVQINSKELPVGKLYQREVLRLLNN
jgi:DNA-binding LytR/AlgR family response regulator